MAYSKDIFYPPKDDEKNEYDIVFIGNRYPGRESRDAGEYEVIVAAAEWAQENGRNMVVFGIGDDSVHSWKNVPLIYESGVYQRRTTRLEAADIYRKSALALSVCSNLSSITMAPNRVIQICGMGKPLLAYKSLGTAMLCGGNCLFSDAKEMTKMMLSGFFDCPEAYQFCVQNASNFVNTYHTFDTRLQMLLRVVDIWKEKQGVSI
jgi:hypothetical protein